MTIVSPVKGEFVNPVTSEAIGNRLSVRSILVSIYEFAVDSLRDSLRERG